MSVKEDPVRLQVMKIPAWKPAAAAYDTVLWDPACSGSFVRNAHAEAMNFPSMAEKMMVCTLGGEVMEIDGVVYQCKIRDLDGKVHEFVAHGLDDVTGELGQPLTLMQIQKLFPHIKAEKEKRKLIGTTQVDYLIGINKASWLPEKVAKASGGGDFWLWENQFGSCVGGSHPLLGEGVTKPNGLHVGRQVKQAQVLADGGEGGDRKLVVAVEKLKELERQLAEVRKEYKDYKLKKEEEEDTRVLEKTKNKAVEESMMIPACQPTSLSCAGRSLMTAALSTRQRPSDSGVVMRHHKGASAEGGRGSADRSTEEEGLPASTEELASADTSRPLEAIVEEKESQLGLTEKGVIRSQGEGEDKPENMEETETNQAKVKKKIVSFCQKVNAGARAFKEKFKVIFKNNGGGGVL